MEIKFVATLCAIAALGTIVQSVDYCTKNLCPAGRRHVGCNAARTFASTCGGNARLINLSPHQRRILNIHNTNRNQIAGGRLSGFQAAVRMATMQWDNELAELAAINVRQCVMRHDECRSTANFRMAGQNLAIMFYTGAVNSRSDLSLIRNLINLWWLEYRSATMSNINSFSSGNLEAIGHFTVFVRDANPRIGCAASRWTNGNRNSFLFACNYATTNILGRPIYIAGRAASGCTTGANRAYRNLCSINEVYAA